LQQSKLQNNKAREQYNWGREGLKKTLILSCYILHRFRSIPSRSVTRSGWL